MSGRVDRRTLRKYKRPGSGRKPGTPNVITKTLQDMILGALSDAGGQDYLRIQALSNPSAFLALVGRVIPLQLKPGTDDPRVAVIKRIVHEHRSSHTIAESAESLNKLTDL